MEFQIVHSSSVWIQGEANRDRNGKILLKIQVVLFFCLWYHQSNERKRCGCSSLQVWLLDIPQEKQIDLLSLKLSQRLSNLHGELNSPQIGQIPLCPFALEVWKSSQEETCLLCSPAWMDRMQFSGDHYWFLLMPQKGQSTVLSQLLRGEHEIFRTRKTDGNNLKLLLCIIDDMYFLAFGSHRGVCCDTLFIVSLSVL